MSFSKKFNLLDTLGQTLVKIGNQLGIPEAIRSAGGMYPGGEDSNEDLYIESEYEENWDQAIDIESQGIEEDHAMSPESLSRKLHKDLKEKLPGGIKVYKDLLYYQMIKSCEHSDYDDDDDEWITQDESVDGYWMNENHLYLYILHQNRESLEENYVFVKFICDDLVHIFVKSKYVDMCVNLFWSHFLQFKFEIHREEEEQPLFDLPVSGESVLRPFPAQRPNLIRRNAFHEESGESDVRVPLLENGFKTE